MTYNPTEEVRGHSVPSPFRPGSIFYDDPSARCPLVTKDAEGWTNHSNSSSTKGTTTNSPPSTMLMDSAAVPLASPPPSPSRNSIFDQPWSAPLGPNISSLRGNSSLGAPPSLSPRLYKSTITNTTPSFVTKGIGSNHNSSHKHLTKDDCTYSRKIYLHNSLDCPEVDSKHVSGDRAADGLTRPSSASRRPASETDTTKAFSPKNLLPSPVHRPCLSPPPSLSLQLPSATLSIHTNDSNSIRLRRTPGASENRILSTIDGQSSFTLDLERNKTNLLGHGRHAEVYRALIHPSSTAMRHYLLYRKATRTMSCSDLFLTDNECEKDDSFVCAAKCLFTDIDSQTVGLAEAHILSQLHASTTSHPGRQYIVDLFGMYCQATKRGYFRDDIMIPLEIGMGDKTENDWILLLEFCQHGSIWDWIRQHPEKVGYRQWLSWALQLMEAVAYIHEAGLVHHDIKPHNILLDSAFNAKLSDFGASRFLPTDASDMNKTNGPSIASRASLKFGLEEGRGRGTLPYSAPEMFASASRGAHYGQAIDIYSLGVSLYVIGLTAQEPFHKLKSVMEMIVWIKKGGFWLWEDQSWVHDRGSIPKARPSSRLSTSSAIQSYSQVQGRGCRDKSRFRSAISGSSPMNSQVAAPPLAPINTQLYRETALLGPSSASSINSPGGADSYYNYPRASPLMQPSSAGHTSSTEYSPERSYKGPQPATPVSPLPLPSPIIKAQTPHSSPRRDENRKSGEMVMRFLNGEVVRPEVIQLLKDMCQLDPELRPEATNILQRLREMKALLDLEHEAEVDMDVDMSM